MLQVFCSYSFKVHVMLSSILNFFVPTFGSICAVTNMAVFCSSLISCFPGILLWYFLNVSKMVPVASVTNDVAFIFHMRCISIYGLKILEYSPLYYYYYYYY